MSSSPEHDDSGATDHEVSPASLPEESSGKKAPTKLEVDRPQDFKFHVAYGVYARAWEENSSDATRLRLNELISALSKDDSENAYLGFYAGIQQYRKDSMSFGRGRTRIQTQRKRDWQRNDTRDRRNRRHR